MYHRDPMEGGEPEPEHGEPRRRVHKTVLQLRDELHELLKKAEMTREAERKRQLKERLWTQR